MHKNYHKGYGIGVSFKRKDSALGWGFIQSKIDLDYWFTIKAMDNLDYLEALQLMKEEGLIK